MAKIKLILCDDEGKPVTEVKAKDYALEVGNQTLDEIEAAVEGADHLGLTNSSGGSL